MQVYVARLSQEDIKAEQKRKHAESGRSKVNLVILEVFNIVDGKEEWKIVGAHELA